MKKFVMMLMLAVFSLGAYAQTQQGQSAYPDPRHL